MVIAQIVTDVSPPPEETLSVFQLALEGGFMMIPILICSLISIYIFFERFFTINKASMNPDSFVSKIKEMVLEGDIDGAKMLCGQFDNPISRMIEKGISRIGSPLKNIEASIENIAKIELFNLEKNLSVLATVSGVAPMMGFLGTVIGMVEAFIAIANQEGTVSPALLSSGIYTAMITTIAGLIVGILSFLAYNFLVTRVSKIVHKMEYSAIEFIDLLQEQR